MEITYCTQPHPELPLLFPSNSWWGFQNGYTQNPEGKKSEFIPRNLNLLSESCNGEFYNYGFFHHNNFFVIYIRRLAIRRISVVAIVVWRGSEVSQNGLQFCICHLRVTGQQLSYLTSPGQSQFLPMGIKYRYLVHKTVARLK